MKTISINLYKFSELSEEAQEKAIKNLWDINNYSDWYEYIYEDAKNIGLEITSFDLDRNRHAKGHFIDSAVVCAENIIKEHGETCETYKTATEFLNTYLPTRDEWEAKNPGYYFSNEPESYDLENDFLNSLLEDYSIMLQNESEYLSSREAIIETIEANDYDFTEDGKLY